MTKLERIVDVMPANDQGACKIRFLVKGPDGAVQFLISTEWYLPQGQRQMRDFHYEFDVNTNSIKPLGMDVGYHSPKAMYADQTPMECDLIDGGKCYYDGSSLRAQQWVIKFLEGGTAWLWPALEGYYHETFEGEPDE